MAIFEVQGQDGQVYEVEADSMEAAASAVASVTAPTAGGVTTNSKAVSELGSNLDAAAHSFHNQAFLGFGDNVQGAMGALAGANPLDPSQYFGGMPDRYTAERDKYRAQLSQKEAAHPMETTAGGIGGAALPALAAAPFATGKSMLGTIGRSAVLGGAEGGMQGAGNADGQGVVRNAIRGALLGAGIGAGAPAVVGVAGAVKNAIKDPITGGIDAVLGVANTGKANRAIAGAAKASGQTPDEISAALARAAAEGQPEFRLMDAMGTAGQRQASGIARATGPSATEISDFLASRQAGQGDRISGFIDDAFGTKGTTAAKTQAGLTEARGATADAAYSAARGNAAPVDVRDALQTIDDRIGGMAGSGVAGDGIDGKLAGYRARLAGDGKGLGPGVTGAELSDFDRVLGVKQAVQDDIGAALRAGRNNEARELGKLASALDAALEGSSDMYRTANDGFREASRVIGAVDEGATMASRGRAADNIPAFDAMTPDMQGAARIGYGDNLLAGLEKNPSPTANKAKPLIQSEKRASEAGAMALDPTIYKDRLSRESVMWDTQNRALGGSRTADNLADQDAVNGMVSGAMGAAKSASNLQLGDAASKVLGMLGPLAKGQNEATRQLIAQALMSGDTSALGVAMRQATTQEGRRRLIEAILRQPAQAAVNH